MRVVMLLLVPISAMAQLSLDTFNGTTESPVGSTYSLGSVAAATNQTVRFRAHNLGTSAVVISTLSLSGSGFKISAVNGSIPFTVAPSTQSFLEFTVTFNGPVASNYSANLQVNSLSVILTASAITPPALNVVSGCTSANGVFDFGNVQIGTLHACVFSLFNPTATPMTISTLSVSGGFIFQVPTATPLVLAAQQAVMFTVQIAPVCGSSTTISGTLTINSQAYGLTAQAITPSLPKPLVTFDGSRFGSAEQHSLTVTLASPAACATTGNLNLKFTPLGSLPGDSTVVFVARNSVSVGFAVAAGASQVAVDGGASVMFATGSTAGSITFTMAGPALAGDPTTSIVIAPAVIAIESATASNQRAGELDVTVTALDNTYSAGAMSFSFFDAGGRQIGAAVTADFTSQFRTFFGSGTAGSSFLMRVSFPVSGQAQVATVQATLTNSAGPAMTGSLIFQ